MSLLHEKRYFKESFPADALIAAGPAFIIVNMRLPTSMQVSWWWLLLWVAALIAGFFFLPYHPQD